MRILFVTHSPHLPEVLRGVERNTDQLCTRLRNMGHQPAVVAGLRSSGWVGKLASLRLKIGDSTRAVRDMTCGYPTYRCWNVDKAFDRVVAQFRPDIVVVQSWVRTVGRCLELGIPAAYYVHSANEPVDPGTDAIRDRTLWITVSAFAARHNGAAAGLALHIVPPLIDPAAYRVSHHDPRHVTVIGLHPDKGPERALALAQACPDIPFVFHDNVPLNQPADALRALARSLPNVSVRPPADSVDELYGRTRVLLMPSPHPETWGRVASEAQVNGIPVLGSDRGALPDAIGPGGICLDYDAPLDSWVGALRRMWDDPAYYAELAACARRHSERAAFQPEVIVGRLVTLLEAHLGVRAATPQDR